MKNYFINKAVSQEKIIKGLAISLIIFATTGYAISLDKLNSFPYFIVGIFISILSYINSSKFKLFSPIYNLFITLFFVYVFSPFIYFSSKYDVMGNETLLNKNIFFEINLMYILFFISIITPILVYFMFIKKHKIKFKIFSINFPISKLNFLLFIFNIIFIFFILSTMVYTKSSPLDIILNTSKFRYSISSGSFSTFYIIISNLFSFNYILVLKDIMQKTNNFNKLNKIIFFMLAFSWSLICGGKGFLIFTVVTPFIIIYTLYRQIKFKHLLIIILGIFIALFYSCIYNQFRSDPLKILNGNYKIEFSELLIFLAKRNDNYANSIQFFRMIDSYDSIIYYKDFHIIDELKIQYTKILPKFIRNNISTNTNDFLIFTTRMTKLIYPDAVANNVFFEFGGISNIFWNLGAIGLIIGGLLIGIFIILIELLFNNYMHKDVFLTVYFTLFYGTISALLQIGIINTVIGMKMIYLVPIIYLCIVVYSLKNKKCV